MRTKLARITTVLAILLITACKKEEAARSDAAGGQAAVAEGRNHKQVARGGTANVTVSVRILGTCLFDGVKSGTPNSPVTVIFPLNATHQAFISVKNSYSPTLDATVHSAGRTFVPARDAFGEQYSQLTLREEEIGFKNIRTATLTYSDSGSGREPASAAEETSLHWLPSLSDILGLSPQNLSPHIQPAALLKIDKGDLKAIIRDNHIWDFRVRETDNPPAFRQVLAGVVVYEFEIPGGSPLTITSRSTASGTATSSDLITIQPDKKNRIELTLGSTMPNDRFEHETVTALEDPHFACYYDLLASPPTSRPTPYQSADLFTNRHPGDPGVTCGCVRK